MENNTSGKDDLRQIMGGASNLLNRAKRGIYRAAGTVEQQVREREGAFGSLANLVDEIVADSRQAYANLSDGIKERFYTDGVFDHEKATDYLGNKANAIRELGIRGYRTLEKVVHDGVEGVRADFRREIPTQEERTTKYAGFGSDVGGLLSRPELEDALEFHTRAKRLLPGGLKLRAQILETIKAHALASPEELIDHYEAFRPDMVETVTKYF
jgi:hypothetical protein